MRRRLSLFFRLRPFSRANRGWWAGIAETGLAATMLMFGVIGLALSLTLAVIYSTSSELYISVGYFSLQLVVSFVLIGLGSYGIISLLWKVGVSDERRGAIVSRAGEIDLLNEIRKRREDLPTVPMDRFPPAQGNELPFKLIPSPRNVWGLISAAIFSISFVALATILVSTAVAKWRIGTPDWLAAGLALAIFLAASWSIYQFFRQSLKLAGIGSTSLEISDYPLVPGQHYEAAIFATRSRPFEIAGH